MTYNIPQLDGYEYTLKCMLATKDNKLLNTQELVTPIETYLQYKSIIDNISADIYWADYPKYCDDKIKELHARLMNDNLFEVRSGDNRCVLLIDSIVVKLDAFYTGDNRMELRLYDYVKRNYKHLLKYLLPPIANIDYVTIYPYVKYVGQAIPNYLIKHIITQFERCGILLYDLEDRWNNFGIYNGRIVIIDYACWDFKKRGR